MRRSVTYPFLGLIVFLLCWINLPPAISDRMRSFVSTPFGKRVFENTSDELSRLKLENRNLRSQIDHAYEWLLLGKKISEQLADREFLQKRASYVKDQLCAQLLSTPAQVIYRDPSLWSSSLWIGVGEKTNRALGKRVIGKNSPVLADGALVGVVEFVAEKQSRVRLITDSGLCPSVRVCRGGLQNRELIHHLDSFLKLLEKRDDLEKDRIVKDLESFKNRIGTHWEDGYLAKGEVHGCSSPFWRSRSPMLKGIGFNYDFPDGINDEKTAPILKEGDLLVTTGLDGVFPPGLPVGTVVKLKPQKASSYSYEIDVRPSVSNLNDLKTLFIIPPVEE